VPLSGESVANSAFAGTQRLKGEGNRLGWRGRKREIFWRSLSKGDELTFLTFVAISELCNGLSEAWNLWKATKDEEGWGFSFTLRLRWVLDEHNSGGSRVGMTPGGDPLAPTKALCALCTPIHRSVKLCQTVYPTMHETFTTMYGPARGAQTVPDHIRAWRERMMGNPRKGLILSCGQSWRLGNTLTFVREVSIFRSKRPVPVVGLGRVNTNFLLAKCA